MVFCCFGGNLSTADFQHSSVISPKASSPGTGDIHVTEERFTISSLRQSQQASNDTLSALRCQLATIQGSWLARAHFCVERVLAACSPFGQVSLFGASPCGSVLVLLSTASAGPGAAGPIISAGHVLPMPAPWLGSSLGGCTPSATAMAVAAVSSNSGGLVILGSPARVPGVQGCRPGEPDVLLWQELGWEARMLSPVVEEAQSILKNRNSRPQAHSPAVEGPPQSPSDAWQRFLSVMAANVAVVSGADAVGADKVTAAAAAVALSPTLRAFLVPVRLGADVVGALLLVSTAAAAVAAASTPGKAELASPVSLPSRELLRDVAAAVAECYLGPHLADIQRVTSAACELAAAPDLQGLASCLSSAVTEALASELHVDFGVRVALVPHAPGARGCPQYGFLLTEQPPAAVTGGHLITHQHAPNAATAAAGGGANGASNLSTATGGATAPLGCELSHRHGPLSRAVTRSLTQQSFADRLLAAKLSSGIPSASAPSLDPLSATLAGGCQPPQSPLPLPLSGLAMGGGGVAGGITGGGTVVVSGVHSFQLAGGYDRRCCTDIPTRIWKARPFSLESTLLSSLAARAAKSSSIASHCICGPTATAAASGLGFGAVLSTVNPLPHYILDDGGPPPSSSWVSSPMQRWGAHAIVTGGYSSYMTVGSSLVNPSYATGVGGGRGTGGSTWGEGYRVRRMGGTVVPHVHAYVNDTEQPSADVVLLIRTAVTNMGVAGPGGRLASAGGSVGGGYLPLAGSGSATASASATASGPASLVLVMGSITLMVSDANHATAEDATSTAAVTQPPGPGTVAEMALPSSTSSMWPATMLRTAASIAGGGYGGGGGVGGFDVCLALYLTAQERLPASLLCAARNRSQVLLELLLPAAGACLSDSASAELQYLWDAVSGSIGGAAGGASGILGRASSVPIGRLQPSKGPGNAAEEGNPAQPHHPSLHLQQLQKQQSLGYPGAVAGLATVDLSINSLLPLPPTAATSAGVCVGGGGSGGSAGKTVVSSSMVNLPSSASLSLRGCGVRDVVGTALSPVATAAVAAAGGGETAETDGASLAQLLMTRGTNNAVTSVPEHGSIAVTTGMLGTGLTTANGTGWSTMTSLGVAATAARDTSETAARTPRSRLSNTTATGHTPPGLVTGTTAASVFMNSCNSLASALMGSGSVTGKVTLGGGVDDAPGMGFSLPSTPTLSPSAGVQAAHPPPIVQQQSAASMQRRTMLLLQQAHPQHLQAASSYRISPASVSGARVLAHGRVHTPPRRQVSDLLATMPWDVSDTLTVMRTNMDILVSSFWNTLRSQTTEAAPSPHAEEDLRFLCLTRVIGGGGCATVYAGLLHGLEVAVKVMKAPSSEDLEDGEESDEEEVKAEAAAAGARRSQHPQQQQQQQPSTPDIEPSAPPAARQAQLRAIMRGARELAVMTSISHPNIVQIYSYHTRVLVKNDIEQQQQQQQPNQEGPGSEGTCRTSATAGGALPRLIPVAESNINCTPGPYQTVLIMECCDLGSLADALDNGMFACAIRNAEAARWRTPPRRSQTVSFLTTNPTDAAGALPHSPYSPYNKASNNMGSSNRPATTAAGGSGMRAIYLTLLEVALALRHMHAMHLVHCDVKPANVLLKSSASDPRGFTCKLTDFGFVNLLQYHVDDVDGPQARPSMRYHEPVGTVTHLAPETMVQGSKLDHTVDIFAFGILMWEVYTGKAPYAEHANNNFRDLPYRVVREGLRPTFPSFTPLAFKSLAQACWSTETSRRPTAAVLVASLQRLMDAAVRA